MLDEREVAFLASVQRVMPAAAASHQTAASLHGLPLIGAVDRPQMTFASAVATPVRHHVAPLPAGDLTTAAGLAVTTVERTLCDLAGHLPLVDVVCLVDAWLARLPEPQRAGCARSLAERSRGGPGGIRLRRALGLADPRAQSPFESGARVALVLGGLGPVDLQAALPGRRHPYDLLLRWADHYVECDGRAHHDDLDPFSSDRAHGNAVARRRSAGLTRLVWGQVFPLPLAAVIEVRAAVAARPGQRSRDLRRQGLELPPRTAARLRAAWTPPPLRPCCGHA